MSVNFEEDILGNSRFATPQELLKAGLINNNGGIVLGKLDGNIIEKPGNIVAHLLNSDFG